MRHQFLKPSRFVQKRQVLIGGFFHQEFHEQRIANGMRQHIHQICFQPRGTQIDFRNFVDIFVENTFEGTAGDRDHRGRFYVSDTAEHSTRTAMSLRLNDEDRASTVPDTIIVEK